MKSYGSGPVTGDNPQALSSSQQAQARANIGAGTGSHAFFTGTSTSIPGINLGATQYLVLTNLTPAVTGDTLANGEKIQVIPNIDLPQGINVAFARVSATNTVRIGVTSSAVISLTATTITWSIVAFR